MAITVGTLVPSGNVTYVIKSLLSKGGFGCAYLAEQVGIFPFQVVIKVPADTVLENPLWLAKFQREARILANIRHKNVVKILAFVELPSGEMALVQELVQSAMEVDEYIKANPHCAPSVLLQTLYALRSFHTSSFPSIVHRDLSPRNILVDREGCVKVIDFGLAKEDPRVTEKLTMTQEWFGTWGCMSPEQMDQCADVDHRTDLYAIGRTFAAALQNRNPAHADPKLLSEPWQTLCSKLTEHEVHDRHIDAQEALEHAMQLFAQHGLQVTNLSRHIDEMYKRPKSTPASWGALFSRQIGYFQDVTQSDIEDFAMVTMDVFRQVDSALLFDRLEASTALANFAAGRVGFEDGDAFGDLYGMLYPMLDNQRKSQCFKRLCETAVRLHRFSIMGKVREVYGLEQDPSMKAHLIQVIDFVDPPNSGQHTIYGRGVIPGRT